MEEHRFVLPSNIFLSQQTPVDSIRARHPLTDATGNTKYYTVANTNTYSNQKGLQPRPPPNFTLPTLPSQPARYDSHRTPLEARKASTRARRAHRSSKASFIIESEQYNAYRSRKIKADSDDAKWPDDLEELFLEAICFLPPMGRRKFSINGKPLGRNELVSLYLWMGYCESVPPGQKFDQTRQRIRKQVSSHIQVLKNFIRNHPGYDLLFPQPPKKGIQDSFKNDPCLRALAQGHLPFRHSNRWEFQPSMEPQKPNYWNPPARLLNPSPNDLEDPPLSNKFLRPCLFRMYMTTLNPGVDFKDVPKDDPGDGKWSTRVHTYSDSIPKALGSASLDILPNWRDRFPILDQLHSQNDLKCPIIYLEIYLELRYGTLPDRSELWAEFELLIPGGKLSRQAVWRCTQNMYKPPDLYGTSASDPRFEDITSTPRIDRYEPGVGTHMRVSFPVSPWAHALQRLSTMEAEFSQAVQSGAPITTPTTARQYINQITLFQELFCSSAPHQPFLRNAIICWTFKKCRAGEEGRATWSYLDPSPTPPRSACFSPHPGPSHVVSAAMAENFNAWADNNMHPSLQISSNTSAPGANPFDPLDQFDSVPPLSSMSVTNGMSFNFANYGLSNGENLSFMSHETQDSDSTLVDGQIGNTRDSAAAAAAEGIHLDGLFGNPGGVGGLGAFDHAQLEHGHGHGHEHGHGLWEPAAPLQTFESDSAFASALVGFGSLQPDGGPVGGWDATGVGGAGDVKNDWNGGNDGGFAAVGATKGEWDDGDGFGGFHLGEDGRGK